MIDSHTRLGFSEISYSVNVESDASPEQLAEIKEAAERTSPMFDNGPLGGLQEREVPDPCEIVDA